MHDDLTVEMFPPQMNEYITLLPRSATLFIAKIFIGFGDIVVFSVWILFCDNRNERRTY